MSFWDQFKSILGVTDNRGHVDLEEVQDVIGYHFRDQSILLLSLTHRSFEIKKNQDSPANERLEFLGDSVLGMVISHQLFLDHQEIREGELTKRKALLVNETTLASVGRRVGLNKFIRLSAEEERSGGRERPSIISDAVESVIAAVYLDGGVDAARDFILRLIYVDKERILSDTSQRNSKGEFLELVQARSQGMPRYEVVSETGPDHCKVFHVEVWAEDQVVGSGKGNSKKEAEQKAASEALENYREASP